MLNDGEEGTTDIEEEKNREVRNIKNEKCGIVFPLVPTWHNDVQPIDQNGRRMISLGILGYCSGYLLGDVFALFSVLSVQSHFI